ncbi:Hypothetical protein NCS54_01322300 [Fusarium falciforme]|uniref:Hypothetical protein n=1 Tax=Fusarium falciforme TaxID=195108 RepID=UPI0023001ECC|nr:Hypothetical protein NCS54_01322300 [Fusarium falciforme]WAO95591.1 Hypothetical protein NCS54_01322300 [Fusarium falciforme]
MAPSKRLKKSSSSARSSSPPLNSLSKNHTEPSPIISNQDQDSQNTAISSGNSANTIDSTGFVDPAIFDEEVTTGDKRKLSPGLPDWPYAGDGGYNALKSFNGQVYSGMAVGGSHTWNYDQGVWHEVKEEPDMWKIDYKTNKRRAKTAPKGSGAPLGTEYHWLIVAHQYVKKIDANTYETNLTGSKYKLAHKAAASKSWSINTVKGQREREIELLEDAKRRVQGLPPVLASEKVKVDNHEKGQQKLEDFFAKPRGNKGADVAEGKKRKREE